jgi:hypothetical protein
MLEIALLIWAGRKLAAIARDKGRSAGYAGLGVGLWFTGEVLGFLIGTALGLELGAYAVALVMAAAGLGLAFLIVSKLEPMAGHDGIAPGSVDGPVEELELVDRDPDDPYAPPRKI